MVDIDETTIHLLPQEESIDENEIQLKVEEVKKAIKDCRMVIVRYHFIPAGRI